MNYKTFLVVLCITGLCSCNDALKEDKKEITHLDTVKSKPQSMDTALTPAPNTYKLDTSIIDDIDTTKGFSMIPIDSLVYQSVQDQSLKAVLDSSYIDKIKNQIKLPLDHRREKVFKDVIIPDDETSNEYYHYVGYYEKPKVYSLWKSRYEDGITFLVQKHNGKVTETWDDPQFNSSGHLIFCKQRSCFPVFQDCYKGYQIWKIMGGDLFKINEKIMENHMVFEAKWKNDQELVIKLLDVMKFLETQYDTKTGFEYYSLKYVH